MLCNQDEAEPPTHQSPGPADEGCRHTAPSPGWDPETHRGLLTAAAEMTAADHPRWQDARTTRPAAAGEGQMPKTHPSPLRSCQETAPPEQEVRVSDARAALHPSGGLRHSAFPGPEKPGFQLSRTATPPCDRGQGTNFPGRRRPPRRKEKAGGIQRRHLPGSYRLPTINSPLPSGGLLSNSDLS